MFGKRSQLVVLCALWCAALLLSTPVLAGGSLGQAAGGRYFYEGDGRLKVAGGGKKLKNLSPRLIAFLDFLQDRLTGGKGLLHIHSGYRSPLYNERLRARGVGAAKSSLHMEGMAADISLRGVAPEKLWHFIRDLNCCGAGYYAGEMVHVDTGPVRFWESATSKTFTDIAAHNNQIFPTTEYDVYAPGEVLQFKLVRMTEFPFGVRNKIRMVDEKGRSILSLRGSASGRDEQSRCIFVHNKTDAQNFSLPLPQKGIPLNKKLKLKLEFCLRPSPKIPRYILSNPFATTNNIKK